MIYLDPGRLSINEQAGEQSEEQWGRVDGGGWVTTDVVTFVVRVFATTDWLPQRSTVFPARLSLLRLVIAFVAIRTST
jgi:hypothetical protein